MTGVSKSPKRVGTHFTQVSHELIEYVVKLGLTGTQHDLLLLLWKIDPYGDRLMDIPNPQELGKLLNVNPRTVERAMQVLSEYKLIEYEIKRWKARNCKTSIVFSENSTDKEIQDLDQTIQNSTNRSKAGISLSIGKEGRSLESKLNQCSENGGKCTNNRQKTLKNKNAKPTPRPVSQAVDGGDIGTLLEIVAASGIPENKTIRRELANLQVRAGSAAARIVENACSAVIEQVSEGTVRNPGGLLVAGLRSGYTANEAKRQVRRRTDPRPPLPDLNAITVSIDQAMLRGDRAFGAGRLQQLWNDGYREQVEELIQLRRDWDFSIGDTGVM